MIKTLFILLGFVPGYLCAQDTLTLMHYNLLYYGKDTHFCDLSVGDMTEKSQHLKHIIQLIRPDIFTVNELDGNSSDPVLDDGDHILDHALNVEGITHYRSAPHKECYLANTLFYNHNKLKLHSWQPIQFRVGEHEKIFNAFTFYYRSDDLSFSTDTAFLTCFVVHLKSGYGDANDRERSQEAEVLMDYITNEMPDSGNYILCGDLNVYSFEDEAYQHFASPLNTGFRFYDPVRQTGKWHDNEKYVLYHTQSTHSEGGCFSSGGMDDRFDFILLSGSVMKGSKELTYIRDSYETIGQDGQSFNTSLNIDSNEVVPSSVARALYGFSDHLPVKLDLYINSNPAVELALDSIYCKPDKPLEEDSVHVYVQLTDTEGRISSLKLFWGRTSGNYPYQAPMELSGNYYTAGLKGMPETSKLYYMVRGYDNARDVLFSSAERQIVFEVDSFLQVTRDNDSGFAISNPVRNWVILFLEENLNQELVVQIVDAAGQVRLSRSYPAFPGKKLSLPVHFLQPGIYWIKIQNKSSFAVNMFLKE